MVIVVCFTGRISSLEEKLQAMEERKVEKEEKCVLPLILEYIGVMIEGVTDVSEPIPNLFPSPFFSHPPWSDREVAFRRETLKTCGFRLSLTQKMP